MATPQAGQWHRTVNGSRVWIDHEIQNPSITRRFIGWKDGETTVRCWTSAGVCWHNGDLNIVEAECPMPLDLDGIKELVGETIRNVESGERRFVAGRRGSEAALLTSVYPDIFHKFVAPEDLLADYTHLDGSPIAKKVNPCPRPSGPFPIGPDHMHDLVGKVIVDKRTGESSVVLCGNDKEVTIYCWSHGDRHRLAFSVQCLTPERLLEEYTYQDGSPIAN